MRVEIVGAGEQPFGEAEPDRELEVVARACASRPRTAPAPGRARATRISIGSSVTS